MEACERRSPSQATGFLGYHVIYSMMSDSLPRCISKPVLLLVVEMPCAPVLVFNLVKGNQRLT